MQYLLDTNVVSEFHRSRPDPKVIGWTKTVRSIDLHLSVLVIGEIRKGIEMVRTRDQARAIVFEEWLDALRNDFGDRILPVTNATAEAWGRLAAIRPIQVVDGLLLATAATAGLMFVTREASRYADFGVPVLNPWS